MSKKSAPYPFTASAYKLVKEPDYVKNCRHCGYLHPKFESTCNNCVVNYCSKLIIDSGISSVCQVCPVCKIAGKCDK